MSMAGACLAPMRRCLTTWCGAADQVLRLAGDDGCKRRWAGDSTVSGWFRFSEKRIYGYHRSFLVNVSKVPLFVVLAWLVPGQPWR